MSLRMLTPSSMPCAQHDVDSAPPSPNPNPGSDAGSAGEGDRRRRSSAGQCREEAEREAALVLDRLSRRRRRLRERHLTTEMKETAELQLAGHIVDARVREVERYSAARRTFLRKSEKHLRGVTKKVSACWWCECVCVCPMAHGPCLSMAAHGTRAARSDAAQAASSVLQGGGASQGALKQSRRGTGGCTSPPLPSLSTAPAPPWTGCRAAAPRWAGEWLVAGDARADSWASRPPGERPVKGAPCPKFGASGRRRCRSRPQPRRSGLFYIQSPAPSAPCWSFPGLFSAVSKGSLDSACVLALTPCAHYAHDAARQGVRGGREEGGWGHSPPRHDQVRVPTSTH